VDKKGIPVSTPDSNTANIPSGCSYQLRARLDWLILELMQINKLSCISYKLVKVVYEKTTYEGTIFVSENLWIKMIAYIFE